jgi:hypothetical protein
MAAMIAIRKITAPIKSCNTDMPDPLHHYRAEQYRERARREQPPADLQRAGRQVQGGVVGIRRSRSGFMPSLNNTALNTAKIANRAASFQLARLAEIRRHTAMSIKISATRTASGDQR